MIGITHSMIPNREALRVGDMVFFGGIVAWCGPQTIHAPFDVEAQTVRILGRISSCLEEEGLTLSSLVSVTVYLPDIRLYDAMNRAYEAAFPGPLPTRKVIISPLTVQGAVVEMTAVASAAEQRTLSMGA